MTKYEVRCCCVPKKLLGWLDWPDECGTNLRFPVLQNERTVTTAVCCEVIELRLAEVRVNEHTYKAVKAEGVPLEKLRRVHGFTENLENPLSTFETGSVSR